MPDFVKCAFLLLLCCTEIPTISTREINVVNLQTKGKRLDDKLSFACLAWTPWINVDNPSYGGDLETLNSPYDIGIPGTIQNYLQYSPVCTIPVSIQCHSHNLSWTELHDKLEIPCQKQHGLVCRNKDQPLEKMCQDYKVRFLCWHACPYLEWSHWIDFDDPSGEGDIEILGDTIPRENWPCSGGEMPLDVECETLSGVPVQQSRKRGLRCNSLGFTCYNNMQVPNHYCDDFKVRFLCPLKDKFPTDYKNAPVNI